MSQLDTAAEDAIEAKLGEVFGEQPEPASGPTPAPAPEPPPPDPAPADIPAPERTPPGETPGQAPGPTLDANLREAALRVGLTDDQVDALMAGNADAATSAFEKLHSSYEAETREWINAGRQQQPGAPQPTAPPLTPVAPAPPNGSPDTSAIAQLFGDQADAVRGKYGADLVDELVGPLAERLLSATSYVESLQQERLEAEIDSFFADLAKKDPISSEVFGERGKVTPEQAEQRGALASFADQAAVGAGAHGHQLSWREALDRAWAFYAGDRVAEIERKRLHQMARSRTSSFTARPGRSATTLAGPAPGEKSDEAAMAAYEEKARALGMNVD